MRKLNDSRNRPLSCPDLGPRMANLNVLVVDDILAIRGILHQMLLFLGVGGRITEAADGWEAWEHLQAGAYDLVICDINMPRVNGFELLEFMRAAPPYRDIPFIMITGEVSEDIVAAAQKTEVDGYLIKPFHLATLEERLGQVLEKKSPASLG